MSSVYIKVSIMILAMISIVISGAAFAGSDLRTFTVSVPFALVLTVISLKIN